MKTTQALVLGGVLSIAWTCAPAFIGSRGGVALAATDEEKAGARALAEQAIQEAYPRGQYEQAIDLLRRAEALVHSPTHWLYIGMANAKLGHLVLAQEALLKASREPLDDSSPEAFKVVVSTATSELDALKPRIGKVTVRLIGAEPSTTTVTVDGAVVPSALVGVPMPVDPGQREFKATAPGMIPTEQQIVVKEGGATEIELTLMPDPNAVSPTPGGNTDSLTLSGSTPSDSGQGLTTKDMLLYGGIGGLALGVGGLVGGYLLYSSGKDPRNNADALYSSCHQPSQDKECSQVQQNQITTWDDQADGKQIPGKIMMGAGGVFLAAGATLVVLSVLQHEPAQPQAGLSVTPWVSLNGAGLNGVF